MGIAWGGQWHNILSFSELISEQRSEFTVCDRDYKKKKQDIKLEHRRVNEHEENLDKTYEIFLNVL